STAPTLTVAPGAVSLSQSAVSIAPATMPSGATATVKLTAKDAFGNQVTGGGLTVVFSLGSGAASGAFSSVTDNHNGTYTSTFTPSSVGSDTFKATIGGQSVTSAAPSLTVTLPTVTLIAPTGAITTLLPTFTWNAVVGADHYDVWVDDTTANVSPFL